MGIQTSHTLNVIYHIKGRENIASTASVGMRNHRIGNQKRYHYSLHHSQITGNIRFLSLKALTDQTLIKFKYLLNLTVAKGD